MLRKASVAVVALALVAGIGGCAGKQKYATVNDVFAVYDTNNDGKITKDEFVVHLKDKEKADVAWQKVDKDNNGFVERTLQNDAPLRVWNEVETDAP